MNYGLVGAGNIGMLYDYNSKKKGYTYFSSIQNLANHKLLAICDIRKLPRRIISQIKVYKNYNLMIANENINCVIIASSPNTHYEIVKNVLNTRIKFIICEKPFRFELKKRNEVNNLIKKKKIIINFSRRFSKTYKNLRNQLQKKKFGNLKVVQFYFSKGLINNGIHYIDFARYLLGFNYVVKKTKLKKSKFIKNDYYGTVDLSFNNINTYLYIDDKKDFYERILLIFDDYLIEIRDNIKLTILRKIIKTNKYQVIKQIDVFRNNQITEMLLTLKNKNNISSIENAFEVNDIIDQILECKKQ
jgi:predicted dehydrogenase